MIVAFPEMVRGAAVIALAIFWALVFLACDSA
jgi:hypothetical protein